MRYVLVCVRYGAGGNGPALLLACERIVRAVHRSEFVKFLMDSAYGVVSNKSLPNSRQQKFSPMIFFWEF